LSDSAVTVIFDESGALSTVTTQTTDPTLQRAKDVATLLPALPSALDAGSDLRKALTPPSLVDQAAEAKAAKELGLIKSPADPLQPLRDRLEEARLLAQLKLAEQLSSATSPPVMITVSEPLSG
jgi:hypothetical protein